MSRRVWAWAAGIVGALVITLGLWAFWLEPASLTVAEHELSLGWPAERSLRVAVLTDLHVGSPFNGIAKLRAMVDRTNAAQPDLGQIDMRQATTEYLKCVEDAAFLES